MQSQFKKKEEKNLLHFCILVKNKRKVKFLKKPYNNIKSNNYLGINNQICSRTVHKKL